jgi:hypothetical protein
MRVLCRRCAAGAIFILCLNAGEAAAAQEASESPTTGHRIRPFVGVGSVGYNFGLEGEYALLPYVSLLGDLQAWVKPYEILCIDACSARDEGWGVATGVRLSSDWALSWGFFLQGTAGFYSFKGRRVGARPSLGMRAGVYARLARWLEPELGLKYQHVVGYESADVSYPAEDWGGLILGFAVPVG